MSEIEQLQTDRMWPRVQPESDPRMEAVAHLHCVLKESEGSYGFRAYASNPRLSNPHWVIHVIEDGKVLYDTTVPRLDVGGDYSHNDIVKMYAKIDELKRIFNSTLDIVSMH